MDAASATRADAWRTRALVFAAHAATFAGLTAWSWRKWPDPLIDFGRELYVPWQITRGRVLHRDIASMFGPLSAHLNALWFRLFGAGLTTLVFANLAILAALVAGIYHLVRVSTDRFTATTCGLTTLVLFGFSEYVPVGNYNFVTPYSHEATHGLALGVAMIAALRSAVAARSASRWTLAGLLFGAVALTKPETTLAAGGAALVVIVSTAALGGEDRRRLGPSAAIFVLSATALPLAFLLYFRRHMSGDEAFVAMARPWSAAFGSGIADNEFYRRGMGLDRPWPNALRVALTFAGAFGFVAASAALARWCGARRAPWRIRAALAAALGLLVLTLSRWGTFASALPLVALVFVASTGASFLRARAERPRAIRELGLLTWSAFALLLLAKIGLKPRIEHYGFYLALPATVAAVVHVCWQIPEALRRAEAGDAASTFRSFGVAAVVASALPYLVVSNARYEAKGVEVGTGRDGFLASGPAGASRGAAVRDAVHELALRGGERTFTVAVLPEGVMVNYLLRKESPLRIVTVMPPEVLAFGERAVTDSLAAAPPDFVVLFRRDTSEYGFARFGADERYGRRTMEWIRVRYRRVAVGGSASDPAEPDVEILERLPEMTPSASEGS